MPDSSLLGEIELANLLIKKGLISRRQFVDGEVRLTLADRRNRNIRISVRNASGLFTKQAKTPEGRATIEHEWSFLKMLEGTTDELSKHLPRSIYFDRRLNLLVSTLIPGGQSMHDHLMAQWVELAARSESVGRAFARLHNRPVPPRALKLRRAPMTFHWNRPPSSLLKNIAPANVRLLAAIQADSVFSDGLDRLQRDWQATTLIHGDAKLDNIVIVPGEVFLVDWELATVGDPRWDVATIFSSFLSSWIATMPMAHGMNIDSMTSRSRIPLAEMQSCATSFWDAYARARGMDSPDRFLQRALAYCGARLVQTAYEYMQYANRLTANAVYLIQMAANLVREPRRGIGLMLGG
jgi:aminoglycoside phosphotransferase (APT) family kinase protein